MKQPQRDRLPSEAKGGSPAGWGAEGLATGYSCAARAQERLAREAGEHRSPALIPPIRLSTLAWAAFPKGSVH